MTEITDLYEIQRLELGILRHLSGICRENGLHFFLSNRSISISTTFSSESLISVFSVNDTSSFSLNKKIAQTRIFNLM